MMSIERRHLEEVRRCAESAPGGPLGQRPFLDEALRFFHYTLEQVTPGDVLKQVCIDVYERQMAVMGELE